MNTFDKDSDNSSSDLDDFEDDDSALSQAAEWVVRLNDATATEADFAAWQAWLAADAAHAQAFQEIQDAWRRSASVSRESLANVGELTEPGVETQSVLQRSPQIRARTRSVSGPLDPARSKMHASIGLSPRTSRRALVFKRPFLAAAAVAAAISGIAGIVLYQNSINTIQTATAELRSVRLPDGSLVSLGPQTRLELDFTRNERRLKMRGGEAYFEVSHAPARPFSVETPAGRVLAVGTAFSVNASTAGRIAVSVTEGMVRVDSPTTDGQSTAKDLVRAGHKFVRDGARSTVESLPSVAVTMSWQQRQLEYRGEPLRAVVADINRYSNIKVQLDDPSLAGLRYTGTVFPDTIDVWLRSLEGVFPIKVIAADNERHLISAGG